MKCYYVNFTLGTTIISLDYVVAFILQELTGYLLTEYTGIPPFHFRPLITSLTGLKDCLCKGHGPISRKHFKCSLVP